MASALDILTTTTGHTLIEKLSRIISENEEEVTRALSLAMPVLLGTLHKKSEKGELSETLFETLQKKEFGKNFLNRLAEKDPPDITEQGEQFLNRFWGTEKNLILETLSKALDLKSGAAGAILQAAAAIIINILAAQIDEEDLRTGDLPDLIRSLTGASSTHDSSLLETFKAKKTDARVIDELEGMIFGGKNKGRNRWTSKLRGMTGGK